MANAGWDSRSLVDMSWQRGPGEGGIQQHRRSALKQPLRTRRAAPVQQDRERERLQRCACERVQAWSAPTAFGSRVRCVCVCFAAASRAGEHLRTWAQACCRVTA